MPSPNPIRQSRDTILKLKKMSRASIKFIYHFIYLFIYARLSLGSNKFVKIDGFNKTGRYREKNAGNTLALTRCTVSSRSVSSLIKKMKGTNVYAPSSGRRLWFHGILHIVGPSFGQLSILHRPINMERKRERGRSNDMSFHIGLHQGCNLSRFLFNE